MWSGFLPCCHLILHDCIHLNLELALRIRPIRSEIIRLKFPQLQSDMEADRKVTSDIIPNLRERRNATARLEQILEGLNRTLILTRYGNTESWARSEENVVIAKCNSLMNSFESLEIHAVLGRRRLQPLKHFLQEESGYRNPSKRYASDIWQHRNHVPMICSTSKGSVDTLASNDRDTYTSSSTSVGKTSVTNTNQNGFAYARGVSTRVDRTTQLKYTALPVIDTCLIALFKTTNCKYIKL